MPLEPVKIKPIERGAFLLNAFIDLGSAFAVFRALQIMETDRDLKIRFGTIVHALENVIPEAEELLRQVCP